MRYIGGKSKVAREIEGAILNSVNERTRYVEPFIGGGSVFARLAPHFDEALCGDVSLDLMLMWQQVFSGTWAPPERLTEPEWQALRTAEASPLRAFAGFGGSFGGKWFRGYARGGIRADGSPRNHQGESARAVMKIASAVALAPSVLARHADYREWDIRQGDVVYCDPPYAASTDWDVNADRAYSHFPNFDIDDFWAVAKEWSEGGAHVFVSSYEAPEGWDCIWEKEKRVTLKRTTDTGGRQTMTERLFVAALGGGDHG